jgi:hypothetical protein
MNTRFDSVNAIRDAGMIRKIREVVSFESSAHVVSTPYGDVRQNRAGDAKSPIGIHGEAASPTV